MIIETKFNVGDVVWYIHRNLVLHQAKIQAIRICVSSLDNLVEIQYDFGLDSRSPWRNEDLFFATQEEAIEEIERRLYGYART